MNAGRVEGCSWSLLWVTLTTALAGCHGFAPEQSICPPAGTVLDMRVTDLHPTVWVQVNGKGPYAFLLDTGATGVVVEPELARELALDRQPDRARVTTPTGIVLLTRTRIESLRLGDAEFRGVPAVITDGAVPRGLGSSFRGILGIALFEQCLVTLDFPRGRLSLRQGELDRRDPGVLGAPIDTDGTPTLRVSLPLSDGARQTIYVKIDTGSDGTLVVPSSMRSRLAIDPTLTGWATGRTISGQFREELVRVRGTLRLGSYAARDPLIAIDDRISLIGMAALGQFALSLDQKHQLIRLTLGHETPASAPSLLPTVRDEP